MYPFKLLGVTEDKSDLGRREPFGHFASHEVEMLDLFPKVRALVKCNQASPGQSRDLDR